jgi:aminoglycoside N3'-acetyltransferase
MVTRDTLLHQLQDLGVQSESSLMVHAGLRKIGPIDGGGDALLDALPSAIGPAGTLLMPLGSEEDEPFDARHSPAERDIGVLAELLRRRTGTEINDHPAGRFAAHGAKALELLEPAPLHDYLGPDSVLARFTAANGWVLRLGADPDTVTLTHLAEYLADLPSKRRIRRHYTWADGREAWIESLDDTDGIVEWTEGDYFGRILTDFVAAGHARCGRVGNATAELFAADPFVRFAVDWMEKHLRSR